MKSTVRTMLISLGVLTLGAGAILGTVNLITEEPIADARRQALATAINDVLPPFDSDPATDVVPGADGTTVYPAYRDGALVGVAVASYSDAAFSGRIEVLCGFDADGTLVDYRVTQTNETPGLGAKADGWFRTDGADVRGSRANLAVKADGGDIDAITGATITSRAFVDALNRARNSYNSFMTTAR